MLESKSNPVVVYKLFYDAKLSFFSYKFCIDACHIRENALSVNTWNKTKFIIWDLFAATEAVNINVLNFSCKNE